MTLEEHYQIEREEGRQQGRNEGILEGKAASVDALVESMQMTVEDACKALKVSVQEYTEAKNR